MYYCFPIQFIWWQWIHSPYLIDWSLMSLTLFPFPTWCISSNIGTSHKPCTNNIEKMYTELLTPHFLFFLILYMPNSNFKYFPKCYEHAQFHTLLSCQTNDGNNHKIHNLLRTYTFCFKQYAIAISKTMQWTRSSIRTKDFSLARMHRHIKLELENLKVFFLYLRCPPANKVRSNSFQIVIESISLGPLLYQQQQKIC